jgi:DNA-binding transcriptional LysR family regulator
MEIYQLKYFTAVAKCENMNQVTREFGISTPALSKAISLLETELGSLLFERTGKRIKLTSFGRAFHSRAIDILDLITSSATDFSKSPMPVKVHLAGRELFLAHIGPSFLSHVKGKLGLGHVQATLTNCTGLEALQFASNGTSDFILTVQEPPANFATKMIYEFESCIWTGRKHPLIKKRIAAKHKHVDIDIDIVEVLEYPFGSPQHKFFDRTSLKSSHDGWRDDLHPRKIDFVTSSLEVLAGLAKEGSCLVFLPDFYGNTTDLVPLKVNGLGFSARQRIFLSTTKHKKIGWIANALHSYRF